MPAEGSRSKPPVLLISSPKVWDTLATALCCLGNGKEEKDLHTYNHLKISTLCLQSFRKQWSSCIATCPGPQMNQESHHSGVTGEAMASFPMLPSLSHTTSSGLPWANVSLCFLSVHSPKGAALASSSSPASACPSPHSGCCAEPVLLPLCKATSDSCFFLFL